MMKFHTDKISGWISTGLPRLEEIIPTSSDLFKTLDRVSERLTSLSPQHLVETLLKARSEAEIFQEKFQSCPHFNSSPELAAEWDKWISSSEGEISSTQCTQAMIYLLTKLPLNGEPAHDRRHILVKDALAGLELCLEDSVSGSKTFF